MGAPPFTWAGQLQWTPPAPFTRMPDTVDPLGAHRRDRTHDQRPCIAAEILASVGGPTVGTGRPGPPKRRGQPLDSLGETT